MRRRRLAAQCALAAVVTMGGVAALGQDAMMAMSGMAAPPQDWAKARLEQSPRHQEWVDIKYGNRTLHAYVVYPEVSRKAPAVLVIHEIFGLTDWAREAADEIAAAGYVAIVPDLLSGEKPDGSTATKDGFSAFPSQQDAMKAVSGLNPDQVTADLNAAADYVKKLPAVNGTLAVAGFCWGGGQSFRFATNRHDLSAAFVFYGPAPDNLGAITAPVYGFYAGNDARITATVPDTKAAMEKAGKKYEAVVYEGAGHGFMRAGEDPTKTSDNEANVKARTEAWARFKTLLKGL
ncbi:dienelactone hydrolase family protein [Silvibacterium sp.]|uniref:dienelactone hydrolase family protein n=1 Tax=Silvibacterium sp. TaxID=1964179 RepID=UPI0039E5C3C0